MSQKLAWSTAPGCYVELENHFEGKNGLELGPGHLFLLLHFGCEDRFKMAPNLKWDKESSAMI